MPKNNPLSIKDRNKIYTYGLAIFKYRLENNIPEGMCTVMSWAAKCLCGEPLNIIAAPYDLQQQMGSNRLDYKGSIHDITATSNIEYYPEIARHEPRTLSAYWYPFDDKGNAKRIAILEKAIRLTQPKTN